MYQKYSHPYQIRLHNHKPSLLSRCPRSAPSIRKWHCAGSHVNWPRPDIPLLRPHFGRHRIFYATAFVQVYPSSSKVCPDRMACRHSRSAPPTMIFRCTSCTVTKKPSDSSFGGCIGLARPWYCLEKGPLEPTSEVVNMTKTNHQDQGYECKHLNSS